MSFKLINRELTVDYSQDLTVEFGITNKTIGQASLRCLMKGDILCTNAFIVDSDIDEFIIKNILQRNIIGLVIEFTAQDQPTNPNHKYHFKAKLYQNDSEISDSEFNEKEKFKDKDETRYLIWRFK